MGTPGCGTPSPVAVPIGAATTDATLSSYPLLGANVQPERVTLGPDGEVWYSGFNFGSVGRVTTSGSVEAWNLQTFVLGIDGAADVGVWFGYFLNQSLGRFDPAKGADLVVVPRGELSDVRVGPDHVYFPITLEGNGALHRLDLATPLVPPLVPLVPVAAGPNRLRPWSACAFRGGSRTAASLGPTSVG